MVDEARLVLHGACSLIRHSRSALHRFGIEEAGQRFLRV